MLLAAAVRLVHLEQVSGTPLLQYPRLFADSDMHMFDEWARRIVGGDVLGRVVYHPLYQWQLDFASRETWDGWYGRTPVFYKAPFYPYLVALLYRVAGSPMLPLALLQIGASCASVVLLLRLGTRLFGPDAGLAAALLLALYPADIHYDVLMLRGPWIVLSALVVTGLLIRVLERPKAIGAVALGASMGLAILVNEGFLLLPWLTLLLLALRIRRGEGRVGILASCLVGVVIGLSPAIVRNLIVGAAPFQFAVTGGAVYAVFNSARVSPFFFEIRPQAFLPVLAASGGGLLSTVIACLHSFAGPMDVARFYLLRASGLVVPLENTDNASFYYAALRDPLLAWLPGYGVLFPLTAIGLFVTARRWRLWLPLVPVILSLASAILLTAPLSRYRATLAVFMMPFAGAALAEIYLRVATGRWRVALAIALGAVSLGATAVWIEHDVVFAGRPPGVVWYRPNEFWLAADAYATAGRYDDARREMRDLLARNPDQRVRAQTLVALAALEVTAGREAEAKEAADLARQVASRNASLLVLVGDLYRSRLHDPRSADACYQEALRSNPPADVATSLAQRLADPGAPTSGEPVP